jgi:hypothetical protein
MFGQKRNKTTKCDTFLNEIVFFYQKKNVMYSGEQAGMCSLGGGLSGTRTEENLFTK